MCISVYERTFHCGNIVAFIVVPALLLLPAPEVLLPFQVREGGKAVKCGGCVCVC